MEPSLDAGTGRDRDGVADVIAADVAGAGRGMPNTGQKDQEQHGYARSCFRNHFFKSFQKLYIAAWPCAPHPFRVFPKGIYEVPFNLTVKHKTFKILVIILLNLLLQYILGWNIMFLDNFRYKILYWIRIV